MPRSRQRVGRPTDYTFPIAAPVPTSLFANEPSDSSSLGAVPWVSDVASQELLVAIDTVVREIGTVLSRYARPLAHREVHGEALMDAPPEAVYRDSYEWRRVRPCIRSASPVPRRRDDDADVWR